MRNFRVFQDLNLYNEWHKTSDLSYWLKKIALIRSIAAGLRYNAAANVFENLSVAVLQYNY